MNTEFKKKLFDMKAEKVRTRQRVVFIDSVVAPGEDIPELEWKSFSKLQKIKKLNEYFKIHSISRTLTLDTLSNYKINSIVFCKSSQQVKSVAISLK